MRPKKKITATHTAHRRVPNSNLRGKKLFLLGICGFVMVTLSLYLNIARPRTTSQFPFGLNAAFRGGPVQDPNQPPAVNSAIRLESGTHVLNIPLSQGTGRIGLSFLYRCEPACDQVWLTYAPSASSSANLHLPVHHPLIPSHWFYVKDQGIVIYQQTPTIDSLAQLLSQPAFILADQSLINQLSFSPVQRVTAVEDATTLENVDYVLTTRQPMADFGPWHRYQTVLPLPSSSAFENSKKQLTLTTNRLLYITDVVAGYVAQ